MSNITIKNLSTLTDYAALMRVAAFIHGDMFYAVHDNSGNEIVKIRQSGNTYLVLDIDEVRL